MLRTLHVIMPMAGEGIRFLKAGYSTPKPLIQHKGKMLFQIALNSINAIDAPRKYSFIVRQEHIRDFKIDRILSAFYPDSNIFPVRKTTRGAVESCLFAEPVINDEDAILILDCDLEFFSSDFNKFVMSTLSCQESEVNGGALVSFESENERYSYAEITAGNRVTRTAEKKVISKFALAGAYFFSNSASFLYASRELIKNQKNSNSEYYVSLLYNYLIDRGEEVILTKADEYYSYGTPEELNSCV